MRRVSEKPAGLTYIENVLNGAVPLSVSAQKTIKLRCHLGPPPPYSYLPLNQCGCPYQTITTRSYWLPLTCMQNIKSPSPPSVAARVPVKKPLFIKISIPTSPRSGRAVFRWQRTLAKNPLGVAPDMYTPKCAPQRAPCSGVGRQARFASARA